MTAGESNNREVSTVVIGKTRNSFLGKTTQALILAAICLASATHAVERVEPDRKVQIEKKAKTPSAATKAKASGFCVKWFVRKLVDAKRHTTVVHFETRR